MKNSISRATIVAITAALALSACTGDEPETFASSAYPAS